MVWSVKKILVPTDGSEVAEVAIDPAVTIAKNLGAEIIAISVVPTSRSAVQGEQMIHEVSKDMAEGYTDRIVKAAKDAGVKARSVIRSGSPADEIMKAARDEDVDLIVMGTQGRHGTKRWTGSVTSAVITYGPVPVLGVRKKEPDIWERYMGL
jgi:nucleotide-binding universal stress UspA family protein